MSARCPTSVRCKAPLGCVCPMKCKQPKSTLPPMVGEGSRSSLARRHSTSHSRVHTGPEGWLLAERPVPTPTSQEPSTDEPRPPDDIAKQEVAEEQEAEETKYWFSSLPPDTSLERLVTL